VQVHSAFLPNYIATLVRCRDLIEQLVRREFSSRYRGSVLGVFWAALNPVLTVLVFSFVFGVIFRARWGSESTAPNFFIIVLLGMIIHGMLAESLSRAPTLILGRASYVKRVVFPLEVLPVVTAVSALINATIALVVVLAANAFMQRSIEPTLLLLPLVLAPFVILIIGIVLFIAAIGVYIRDLSQIVNFITMMALFLAPVFYPLTMVPEKYRPLMFLNPLTLIIEQARDVALFGQLPDWLGLGIYAVVAIGFAWFGFWWFQRIRKGFADVM